MAPPGLTDAVGLDAAPGQVGQAGPGGGALQEISLLAPEEQDAPHLCQWETITQLPRDSQAFIPCISKGDIPLSPPHPSQEQLHTQGSSQLSKNPTYGASELIKPKINSLNPKIKVTN